MSFFSLVTIKEISVPPLNNFASGYFLITFFNSLMVLGAKYFLLELFIDIFCCLIFFKRVMVFFSFLLN